MKRWDVGEKDLPDDEDDGLDDKIGSENLWCGCTSEKCRRHLKSKRKMV